MPPFAGDDFTFAELAANDDFSGMIAVMEREHAEKGKQCQKWFTPTASQECTPSAAQPIAPATETQTAPECNPPALPTVEGRDETALAEDDLLQMATNDDFVSMFGVMEREDAEKKVPEEDWGEFLGELLELPPDSEMADHPELADDWEMDWDAIGDIATLPIPVTKSVISVMGHDMIRVKASLKAAPRGPTGPRGPRGLRESTKVRRGKPRKARAAVKEAGTYVRVKLEERQAVSANLSGSIVVEGGHYVQPNIQPAAPAPLITQPIPAPIQAPIPAPIPAPQLIPLRQPQRPQVRGGGLQQFRRGGG